MSTRTDPIRYYISARKTGNMWAYDNVGGIFIDVGCLEIEGAIDAEDQNFQMPLSKIEFLFNIQKLGIFNRIPDRFLGLVDKTQEQIL